MLRKVSSLLRIKMAVTIQSPKVKGVNRFRHYCAILAKQDGGVFGMSKVRKRRCQYVSTLLRNKMAAFLECPKLERG